MINRERDQLLMLIADAYKRMATNTDPQYRGDQKRKCDEWLNRLTQLWEQDHATFSM